MKKVLPIIILLLFSAETFSQNYDTKKLKILATIWGEIYLFHPSIIRNDKNVEWEKSFVEFLPRIKQSMATEEFIKTINSHLLSALDDPFTIVQNKQFMNSVEQEKIIANTLYDYVRITENDLSNISRLSDFDVLIFDRNSQKPLLIDVRIDNELNFDYHTNSFVDYFAGMFIDEEIPCSMLASREHFGWDEYNDWWYYEQRWKIKNIDKDGYVNINPFLSYAHELQQYLPDFDFDKFRTIRRPVFLLTNNSFLSYFFPLVTALSQNRNHFHVINENNGNLFTHGNSYLMTYDLGESHFILNPNVFINKGIAVSTTDFFNVKSINEENLKSIIQSNPVLNKNPFSFNIAPKSYESQGERLSGEEKILAIIKIWTIVKYFNVNSDLCSLDWENSLEKYLEEAQKTSSDKEFFLLVQEMMSYLNDSHVSTFHPSILDFSAIFVAPIYFDYIEDKVIVTAIDKEAVSGIQIGDEILSIDGRSISQILEEEKRFISASNRQGFISTVINPGYFIGEAGSMMKLEIKQKNKSISKEFSRTIPVFQIMGMDDKRENSSILKNNIGYINIAFTQSGEELEAELRQMQNTESLIIDLRGFSPMWDYNGFLELLFNTKTTVRIDQTYIVSAENPNNQQIASNRYTINPNSSFTYSNPIIVLVDKTMISRPEDIAICLQSLPNVTFVGEQTQGTDGEMTKIHLPGGGETSFTGQIIITPKNGNRFQGKGIIPDVKVNRTIKGVKANKDEPLEKAIEILTNKH